MKKTALLLTVVLVLGVALVAYAGATKFTLTQGSPPLYPAQTARSGFAIVNNNSQQTIIQIQVRGMDMAPGTKYYAYYWQAGYTVLGELKMNKSGSGNFHANVKGGISGGYYLGVSSVDTGISPATQFLWIWVP